VVSFALSIFLCSCGGCRISWALELTVSKNWHLKLRAGQSLVHGHFGYIGFITCIQWFQI
jgi:hypothetical protein